jgi:hypothetical protein
VPEIVAETIRLAAEAGLVGCSIEDASGNPGAPIFELSHATERIAAAAAAARALPFPFTLTGRIENLLRGRLDLDDTIQRLKAYETAGADAPMAGYRGGLRFPTALPEDAAVVCGPSSQRTLSWREMDSNHRSPVRWTAF